MKNNTNKNNKGEEIFWIRYDPLKSNDESKLLSMSAMGAYTRLRDSCFTTKPLPDDNKKLARLCGCTVAEFKAIHDEIVVMFDIDDDGWWHKGMMNAIAEAKAGRKSQFEKSSKGGKESAKRRAEQRAALSAVQTGLPPRKVQP